MTENDRLTRGQMQRNLEQKIQNLYRQELGHQPKKVNCTISDEKISIVLENSVTQPENLLNESNQNNLSKDIRFELDEAIQPKLKQLVEDEVGIEVVDVLMDTELETERSGVILILASSPNLRSNKSS